MKDIATDKNKFLFQSIFESINLYGTEGLQFILLNLKSDSPLRKVEVRNHSLSDLFLEIQRAIEINGIDHVIYLIQNKKNHLPSYTEPLCHTEKLHKKVVGVACKHFNTDIESMMDNNNRDGKRIYASGTIIKILIEVFNYSVEEVQKIIPKSKPVISTHKMLITNLDYKHPTERDIFKKYLFCKHEVIKFILNQDNGI